MMIEKSFLGKEKNRLLYSFVISTKLRKIALYSNHLLTVNKIIEGGFESIIWTQKS